MPKVATKGQKQIFEENQETLAFYRKMLIASNAFYLFISFLRRDTMPWTDIAFFIFSSLIFIGSYRFMAYMAKAKTSPTGQLTDAGTDLNVSSGTAEHVKDIIILTSICQCLSVISNYFWLLWLLVPLMAFRLFWKYILKPYFFQPVPVENEERNEKKAKKLERKMAKAKY
ncbi:unnamed protein product [Notodromas monacha]|uniref:Transmembrane protein 208 n=1 Tax=Notodromas monacha TaxID=399045 RepID=A0A7R9GAZ4_9CRUS|nr:unnamed protein product [Notodromas monacha]CAG0914510.1 unnamed protein product [Notodromas monacha]